MANHKRARALDTQHFQASVKQGKSGGELQKRQDAVIRQIIMRAALQEAGGKK